jgi:branched-subunit amino acid transport protein
MSHTSTQKKIQSKGLEHCLLIKNNVLLIVFSIFALISPELFATDGGVLVEQTNSFFSFFRGQGAGILILIAIIYAAGVAILTSNLKHIMVGGVAVVFLFVMKGWAATTYSIII